MDLINIIESRKGGKNKGESLEYYLRKAIISLPEFLQIRITDEVYKKLFNLYY